MPVEALPPSEDIELTDKVDLINRAIDRAKSEERAWPSIQFLWEGHPYCIGSRASGYLLP